MKLFKLFFLACLLVSCLKAENSVVSLRTFLLSGGNMPEMWVNVEGEDEPVELVWSGVQPTQPLNVVHSGKLEFLHYVEGPNGEETLEVLRAVSFPSSAEEILLLGIVDNGVGKYLAIKDVFMTAKFNDWLAFNASSQTVAFKAGDKGKPVIVEAGASLIFRPDIEEGKGVKVMAIAARDGEYRPFFSTYWPAFAGQRTMIIFYQEGDRMRARRIGDRFIRKSN